MATIRKGILGTPKGRIANIIGYQRKGQGIIQSISKGKGASINSSLQDKVASTKQLFNFFRSLPIPIQNEVWKNFKFNLGWSATWMQQNSKYFFADGTFNLDEINAGNNSIQDQLDVTFNFNPNPIFYLTRITGLSNFYPINTTYRATVMIIGQSLSFSTSGSLQISSDTIQVPVPLNTIPVATPFTQILTIYEESTGKSNTSYTASGIR